MVVRVGCGTGLDGKGGGAVSLTAKQQLFIDEYLKCWNATEAARRAGYDGDNNTLGVVGYENLRKPKISEVIERRIKESAMSANEVLMRLARQARGDMGEFAHIATSADIANHPQSDIIKKFKKRRFYKDGEVTEETIELELYDSHAPLVDIGKAHGIFTDKHQIDINDTTLTDEERIRRIATILDAARERRD